WDAAAGGYALGRFPAPWREWNDRFLDDVRRFWRGDEAAAALAFRLTGSSDVMAARTPSANVNFVAAHDGFTLEDVASYARKHNEANAENNRDGTDENFSRNYGVEGPSDDPVVRGLRFRQKRNLMATLLLSLVVPMILSGDELGHSQNGNNNAYCQDNETSWINWTPRTPDDIAYFRFVKRAIALRKTHPAFRRDEFFLCQPGPNGLRDIDWLHADGRELSERDWGNPSLNVFGCAFSETPRHALLLNARPKPVTFRLPAGEPRHWHCLLDTASEDGVPATARAQDTWLLEAHSLMLLTESAP